MEAQIETNISELQKLFAEMEEIIEKINAFEIKIISPVQSVIILRVLDNCIKDSQVVH